MSKIPKLGDQIVPPPETPVVTDPVPTTPSGLSAPPFDPPLPDGATVVDGLPVDEAAAEAAALAAPPPEPEPLPAFSILLEGGDGRRVAVAKEELHAFRVYGLNGLAYEHVSNAPDGEWEYRQTK